MKQIEAAMNISEFNYKKLEQNVESLKLPNNKWTAIPDREGEIMFLRVETDYSSYLAVSLDSEMNMNVYYHSEILKWIKCDKPQTEKDIEDNLKMIDKIIHSSVMYMDN